MICVSAGNEWIELMSEDTEDICYLAQALFRCSGEQIVLRGVYRVSLIFLRETLTNDHEITYPSGTQSDDGQLCLLDG